MDLATAFFLGYFALPLWCMGAFMLLFIVDVVLCETDEFGWATFLIVTGTGLLAWLGADVNPFTWAWHNFGEILKFLIFYFVIGGLWSVGKWYLYLLRVREKLRAGEFVDENWSYRDKGDEEKRKRTRPEVSYATNNKGRLMGWIAHWPFSMIGSIFGDFLTRIVKDIYNVLSKLYDRIADSVFEDFDKP